jgi:tetratricopeptide (TPR) repeat protein
MGRLDAALALLEEARSSLQAVAPPFDAMPRAALIEGLYHLTVGAFEQAEAQFGAALTLAESQQEPLLVAESLLSIAQSQLARGDLNAASNTFQVAGQQFQMLEDSSGDGRAMLGVAQTLIGRESWEEALQQCEGAMTRFQQSDDLAGQADMHFTSGLAYQGSGQPNEVGIRFTQALALYQQLQNPLSEADVRYELAALALDTGRLDRAQDEFTQALTLVEHVAQMLRVPEQQSSFLQQYVELYAQAGITALRSGQDTRAQELVSFYKRAAGPAGSAAMTRYLRAYEASVSTEGEELSRQEQLENASFVKKLRKL